ncbi:MAG: XRE family transcriptional regulator [Candidatus Competibacteraceae bacterium]|nr:XRE family transcriptional regulator [Candidatus Competibacteraceae bacterium]
MSGLVLDDVRYRGASWGTSGDGILQPIHAWILLRMSGALAPQPTTSSAPLSRWTDELAAAPQTSSGAATNPVMPPPSAAIIELRRRSGLTWEQLARLLGVAPRSVHFWASGKPLNAAHEERLGRVLAVIRQIDQGQARATRAALMTAASDGVMPFDLLLTDRFAEVTERLGASPPRPMPPRPPLAAHARAARRPPPPNEQVGALHETVHREIDRSRTPKTIKIKTPP